METLLIWKIVLPVVVIVGSIAVYYATMNIMKEREDFQDKSTKLLNRKKMEQEEQKKERVNHPDYYNQHPSGIECIEIIRHYCFDIGNAIKYLWRAGLKKESSMSDKQKEIEDLRKAIWYINDRIKQLESEV